MRVIAKRTLRAFYQQAHHKDAKGPLEAWHAETIKAEWLTPHDIKSQIGSASIVTDSLVVFNIAEKNTGKHKGDGGNSGIRLISSEYHAWHNDYIIAEPNPIISGTVAEVGQWLTRRLSKNRRPIVEKPFWPDFPIKFVEYTQYPPHLIKKSDSKWRSLATASILEQPPG